MGLGFNKVVKTLQENKLVWVVVSPNLPEKMLDILLNLCQLRNVSIIGLECLDQVTQSCLGFSCSVIAVSNNGEETFLAEMTRKAIEFAFDDDNKMEVNGDNSSKEKKNIIDSKPSCNNVSQKNHKEEVKEPRKLHLKRKSKSERAFVINQTLKINHHSNGEPKH